MKNYNHLNNRAVFKFNWPQRMMQKAMPSRAFTGELTRNIMLSIQAMLTKAFLQADRIKRYKSF